MNKFFILFISSLFLFGNDNYCSYVKKTVTDDQKIRYSYLLSLCDGMENVAEKLHDLYRSSHNIPLNKNILLKDEELLTVKDGKIKYDFANPADFKKVFTADKNNYKIILEDIRQESMRRRYVEALLHHVDKNYKRTKGECISGSIIEGNQIIGIKNRGFITVEDRGDIILRWYKDTDECEVVKSEDDMLFTQEEFKNLGLDLEND